MFCHDDSHHHSNPSLPSITDSKDAEFEDLPLLSDLGRFLVLGDQLTDEVRLGAEELGCKDPCLPEDEARALAVSVSIVHFSKSRFLIFW